MNKIFNVCIVVFDENGNRQEVEFKTKNPLEDIEAYKKHILLNNVFNTKKVSSYTIQPYSHLRLIK